MYYKLSIYYSVFFYTASPKNKRLRRKWGNMSIFKLQSILSKWSYRSCQSICQIEIVIMKFVLFILRYCFLVYLVCLLICSYISLNVYKTKFKLSEWYNWVEYSTKLLHVRQIKKYILHTVKNNFVTILKVYSLRKRICSIISSIWMIKNNRKLIIISNKLMVS